MSTNYHTPHAFASPLTSAQVNGPLGTLDAQITSLSTPRVNVMEYGAVGDGTADDTTAIQNAISALPRSGGTVLFPPGTYKVTSTLTVGNVNRASGDYLLLGVGGVGSSGYGASRINFTGANQAALDCTAGTVVFQNMMLYGPVATGTDTNSIGIKSNYDIHMVNSSVWNFYIGVSTYGLVAGTSGSWYSSIVSSWIRDAYYACIRSQGNNLSVIDSHTAFGQFGFIAQQGASIRLISSAFESASTAGVFLSGTLAAVVHGCYFENYSDSAHAGAAATGVAHIWLGGNATSYATDISGNYFSATSYPAGFYHIRLGGVKNCIIGANSFGTSGGHAVVYSAATDASVVHGVSYLDNWFQEGEATALGNAITAGSDGITVRGSGITVSDIAGSAQALAAATAIVVTAGETIPFTCTGAVTTTAAPTIANGLDGQIIRLLNVGTGTYTIKDQGTLASSNLRLTAATVAIAPRQSVMLQYSAAVGDWVQIGNLVAVI